MKALVVVGLGFGDEGKGSLVDALVRAHGAGTVVRFNGGAQAAHTVVAPGGARHTFAQFGAGTLVPGVRTFLSRHVLLNPQALLAEERHLRAIGVGDALARLTIDADCPVTTPLHIAANRLRTRSQGGARHGTTGMGIGETASDLEHGFVIRAGSLADRSLEARLQDLQARKLAQCEQLGVARADAPAEWDLLARRAVPGEIAAQLRAIARRLRIVHDHALSGTVVFEGAQGVLLDERYGFHPHTTWSTTTFANANALLDEHGFDDVLRIGALRAYATRHGEGPFVTQNEALDLPEPQTDARWAGAFRVGHADLVALRYALRVAGGVGGDGVDGLAITCLDRLSARVRLATAYRHTPTGALLTTLAPGADLAGQERLTHRLLRSVPVFEQIAAGDLPARLADETGLPVLVESYGPTAADKRLRGAARRRTVSVGARAARQASASCGMPSVARLRFA
jgi:adenylosuccinate synthase